MKTNTKNIAFSSYIDRAKVARLSLKTEYFGAWETPADERREGFCLRAMAENDNDGQHVENFCFRAGCTKEAAISAAKAFAAEQGLPLYINGELAKFAEKRTS